METGEAERANVTGPAAALRLIRHRNFGPYFAGNASSATGTWFQNLAASLFVYRQTHSPFLLGVLQFANFIPVLLLAPWAGSAAESCPLPPSITIRFGAVANDASWVSPVPSERRANRREITSAIAAKSSGSSLAVLIPNLR